ncbi:MAG TPA: tetratricopeptide repeat protein [Candidatus Binataceae bacterium]|nr:tetratricopeptide repeat protein [Candidatus Binataceae bacterium]
MATSSHRKISRKELKRPDEFVTFVDSVGEFLADNLFRVIIGAVVVIALVAAGFAISFYESHRTRVAAEDFYQGMRSLEHKDYKQAEQKFVELARSHGNSAPGRLAQFYLASAYLDDKQPAKARDTLEAFLKRPDRTTFTQMALAQLGVANEDMGDYRDAHEAYLRAAMMDGPQKRIAELGVARTLALLGRKTEAIAAYQRFLKENPFSQERDSVVEALATLGVAPEASAPPGRTIAIPPAGSSPNKSSTAAAPASRAQPPQPASGAKGEPAGQSK